MASLNYRARGVAPALAVAGFVAQKAAFLWGLAVLTGVSVFTSLNRWDAMWYARVVDDGYVWPGVVRGRYGMQSDLAFFPLYPYMAKAISALTGLSTLHALYVAAWLGSILAALGIYAVGKTLGGRNLGVVLTLLWAIVPRSLVQVMPYSEGLFTAGVAWALWALLNRRWWLAGLATCLAGLTRPAALPLMATLWIVWLVEAVRARRDGAHWSEAIGWSRLGAATLGSVGYVGYWAYVGWRVGDPLGYLTVQKAWGSTMGTPFDTIASLWNPASTDPQYSTWIFVVLLAYTAMLVWLIWRREPWPMVVFAAASLLLVWSQQGFFYAKARFLVPAFPLLVPLGRVLIKMPRWLQGLFIAAATVWSVLWEISIARGQWSP